MTIKVSTKGRVVLPDLLRRNLGIRVGDSLEARVEAGRLILIPRSKRRYQARIVRDSITGLAVLDAGPDAPVLSSEDFREMLERI